jgi:hypothetical protein
MDFVYDLKDKLNEQNMEYIIMIVHSKKDESIVDTFYNVQTEDNQAILCECMDNICLSWASGEELDGEIRVEDPDSALSDLEFELDLPEEGNPFLTMDDEGDDEDDEDDEKNKKNNKDK